MKTIYNEGRVVGISTYESYVRQMLATNPSADPLDERRWLSASLSANQSMILKVSAGTRKGYKDYKLPANSDLCGCSAIFASIFEGSCTMDSSGYWAVEVDDYGPLISNTYKRHPVTPGEPANVPAKIDMDNPEFDEQCKEYFKVSRALMIQPGEWESYYYDSELLIQGDQPLLVQGEQTLLVNCSDHGAYMNFEPNFAKTGFIRLRIDHDIEHDFYIMITGFSYKTLVHGEISYEMIDFLQFPQDGDFLGPAQFPWACEIYLTVTTAAVRKLENSLVEAEEIIKKLKETLMWQGTKDEWDSLPATEKSQYKLVSLSDE